MSFLRIFWLFEDSEFSEQIKKCSPAWSRPSQAFAKPRMWLVSAWNRSTKFRKLSTNHSRELSKISNRNTPLTEKTEIYSLCRVKKILFRTVVSHKCPKKKIMKFSLFRPMRIKDFESDVFHWFINKSISKIEVILGKLIYSSKVTIFLTVIGQNWSFLIGPKLDSLLIGSFSKYKF